MIEIELFYYTALSSIRQEQAGYLKRQRSIPFEQELPEVEEFNAEAYAKMKFLQKLSYRWALWKQMRRYKKALKAQREPMDERLTRGYNAGVEMALRVLSDEYRTYAKRMKKEE